MVVEVVLRNLCTRVVQHDDGDRLAIGLPIENRLTPGVELPFVLDQSLVIVIDWSDTGPGCGVTLPVGPVTNWTFETLLINSTSLTPATRTPSISTENLCPEIAAPRSAAAAGVAPVVRRGRSEGANGPSGVGLAFRPGARSR